MRTTRRKTYLMTFLKSPDTSEKMKSGSGTENKSSSTTSKEGIGMASGTEAEAIVTFGTQGARARL
jgi:hypothetical protein